MANFCSKCGTALGADGICPQCSFKASQGPHNSGYNPAPGQPHYSPRNPNPPKSFDASQVTGFFEGLKNRMGIGDPDLNKGDAFEKGKWIIPDCVSANENEVPVKQYTVAKLRSRLLGITYSKAIGRILVTNKRVIFRAPGRCLVGRTTLQHEFTIDEIAGIEARREYVANISDAFIGLIVNSLGTALTVMLLANMDRDVASVLGIIFGLILLVPFFLINKHWLLKLFINGIAGGCLMTPLFFDSDNVFFYLLALISVIITIVNLVIHSIRPNLVLMVKTNAATDAAIDIQRKKFSLFGRAASGPDHTGYTEVLPENDAEKSIRELGALINDIKTLGDFGIAKWKK